jgi:hypothetical protein
VRKRSRKKENSYLRVAINQFSLFLPPCSRPPHVHALQTDNFLWTGRRCAAAAAGRLAEHCYCFAAAAARKRNVGFFATGLQHEPGRLFWLQDGPSALSDVVCPTAASLFFSCLSLFLCCTRAKGGKEGNGEWKKKKKGITYSVIYYLRLVCYVMSVMSAKG